MSRCIDTFKVVELLPHGYILLTPAKNEEENLPVVAESVVSQTLKPNLWLIVDDGSTDKTSLIINKLTQRYEWIKGKKLELTSERDITFHYSQVCRSGFDQLLALAKENHIPFDFIGLLDADTVVERDYFEKLIVEFDKDRRLGILSGVLYSKRGNKWIKDVNLIGHPRGTGRLWRKRCFFDTGGYRPYPSPDSISNRLALKFGWKIKQVEHARAYQLRETSSAEGKIKGYIKNGEMARYLGKRFHIVIMGAIFYSISTVNPLVGGAYLLGYAKYFRGSIEIPRGIQELFEKRMYRVVL